MTTRVRTLLTQIGSFILAGVLLYAALRGVDLSEIGTALKESDYTWLIPLIGIVLLSHWLRAWRWRILLEALPEETSEKPRRTISTGATFNSVMIGYMVNYAAPRLGEVARTANLATREKLQFSSVLGTVVVERILDMIVLLIALVSIPILFLDHLSGLNALFIAPLVERLGHISVLTLLGLTTCTGALVFVTYRHLVRRESALQRFWLNRIQPVMLSFRTGVFTLLRTRRRLALTVSTCAMWFCYLLMAYLPLEILGMVSRYDLSLLDAWGIMVMGSLGIVVPSPGGTGSYHYITRETLTLLFGVDPTPATTYAILTHGAQLILYVVTGFICLLVQGSSIRSLAPRKPSTNTGDEETSTDDSPTEPGPTPPSSRPNLLVTRPAK